MKNSNKEEQQQQNKEDKVYQLSKKCMCKKHTSKSLEYFCSNLQCSQRVFCSACILKREFCRHDINTEIKDLAEFLYEQKVMFDMKGLSGNPDIFNYLMNRDKRQKLYQEKVFDEYFKFEAECENLLKQVHQVIEELKSNIKSKIEEFNQNYQKTSQKLINKISESFQQSFMSKFSTFPEVILSFDISQEKGLSEMVEKMLESQQKISNTEQMGKIYQDIISLEKQIPSIDFERFESIKGHFNVFHDKLAQSASLLITIHDDFEDELSVQTEKVDEEQQQQLKQANLGSIRKIACSANFQSQHTRSIYSICKLENKFFATASDDSLIKIWNSVTMECEATLKGHTSGIRSLCSLPNGYLASSSYDKTIKIWNTGCLPPNFKQMQNNKKSDQKGNSPMESVGSSTLGLVQQPSLLKTLQGHLSSVLCVRYLGENQLASGSSDYTIKVWDLTSGDVQKTLSGHMNDVLCLASSRNMVHLATGSSDKTIKLWGLNKKYSSACLKTLSGHTDYVWSIVICPDDVTLVSGSVDKNIKVWNIEQGQLLYSLTGHGQQVTQVGIYGEGIIISSSLDSTLKFWDMSLKLCVHTLEGHKGAVNSFSIIDSQSILSGGADKNILVWN